MIDLEVKSTTEVAAAKAARHIKTNNIRNIIIANPKPSEATIFVLFFERLGCRCVSVSS